MKSLLLYTLICLAGIMPALAENKETSTERQNAHVTVSEKLLFCSHLPDYFQIHILNNLPIPGTLEHAVLYGTEAEVDKLIASGGKWRLFCRHNHFTPMHWALLRGDFQRAENLRLQHVKHGIDIKDLDGWLSLQECAALSQNPQTLKMIHEKWQLPLKRGLGVNTPLLSSVAMSGDLKYFKAAEKFIPAAADIEQRLGILLCSLLSKSTDLFQYICTQEEYLPAFRQYRHFLKVVALELKLTGFNDILKVEEKVDGTPDEIRMMTQLYLSSPNADEYLQRLKIHLKDFPENLSYVRWQADSSFSSLEDDQVKASYMRLIAADEDFLTYSSLSSLFTIKDPELLKNLVKSLPLKDRLTPMAINISSNLSKAALEFLLDELQSLNPSGTPHICNSIFRSDNYGELLKILCSHERFETDFRTQLIDSLSCNAPLEIIEFCRKMKPELFEKTIDFNIGNCSLDWLIFLKKHKVKTAPVSQNEYLSAFIPASKQLGKLKYLIEELKIKLPEPEHTSNALQTMFSLNARGTALPFKSLLSLSGENTRWSMLATALTSSESAFAFLLTRLSEEDILRTNTDGMTLLHILMLFHSGAPYSHYLHLKPYLPVLGNLADSRGLMPGHTLHIAHDLQLVKSLVEEDGVAIPSDYSNLLQDSGLYKSSPMQLSKKLIRAWLKRQNSTNE